VHSRLLNDALSDFAEEASKALQDELAAGAEIPFELASSSSGSGRRRRRGSNGGGELFMYRPLTADFVRQRWRMLSGLRSCPDALRALESSHGLERYVAAHGGSRGTGGSGSGGRGTSARGGAELGASIGFGGGSRSRASANEALRAFVEDVFGEQSDFQLHGERLSEALARVDAAAAAEGATLTLVATLHGVALSSPELPLAHGLTIARPEAVSGLPEQALWPGRGETGNEHLVVLFSAGDCDDPGAAIAHGKEVLRDLLRALRLFGDGRISLGQLAWARIDGGSFDSIVLGEAGRPRRVLLITPAQEDELRAFCSLVSRRYPSGDTLAWALRRFELGCAQASDYEGLSDHLLALQALLEPTRSSQGLLAARVAALCATPEQRQETAERVLEAVELERAAVAGEALRNAAGVELAHEISDWLKALLSDVICGHLDRDLAKVADDLLLVEDRADAELRAEASRETNAKLRASRRGREGTGSRKTSRAREAAKPSPSASSREAGQEVTTTLGTKRRVTEKVNAQRRAAETITAKRRAAETITAKRRVAKASGSVAAQESSEPDDSLDALAQGTLPV
jgi:hypothetical protein